MITYRNSIDGITADQLTEFMAGWPNPPTPETLLRILHGSDHVVLAFDDEAGRVIGYITAISDGVSCAYIPHLEVHTRYRGADIGSELVRRMIERLRSLYMIDLICDPEIQPFYARLGFQPHTGMIIRNYDRQSCE